MRILNSVYWMKTWITLSAVACALLSVVAILLAITSIQQGAEIQVLKESVSALSQRPQQVLNYYEAPDLVEKRDPRRWSPVDAELCALPMR